MTHVWERWGRSFFELNGREAERDNPGKIGQNDLEGNSGGRPKLRGN